MISILIPVFNTDIRYIKQCLDSIEQQTYSEYEVIIVNDGSDEDISNFLHSYKLANSQTKYTVIDQEKRGISAALNTGIKLCQYDIIARMDADDIMLPDRLEKQIFYIHQKEVDILGAQMILFGDLNFTTNHPLIIPKNVMAYLDWFMNHPTVMYKKQKIIDIGGYNSEYDGCEDLELWCRALSNNLVLHNMSDIVLKHRRHKNNATATQNHDSVQQKIFHIRSFYYNKILNSTC